MNCGTCRFWVRGEIPDKSWGDCILLGDDYMIDGSGQNPTDPPDVLAFPMPFAGADGASFCTSESFGCVHHQSVPRFPA